MGQKKQLTLHWLEEALPNSCGVTWGVPWHKGELNRSQAGTFSLIGPQETLWSFRAGQPPIGLTAA